VGKRFGGKDIQFDGEEKGAQLGKKTILTETLTCSTFVIKLVSAPGSVALAGSGPNSSRNPMRSLGGKALFSAEAI